ncbi:Fibrillin-3, partial [Manis pentadactyla]
MACESEGQWSRLRGAGAATGRDSGWEGHGSGWGAVDAKVGGQCREEPGIQGEGTGTEGPGAAAAAAEPIWER